MLRAHDEHGVCLSADHTATSTFFADDSTLLAKSVTHLQAQLEIVDESCDNSGAKLNLSKSVLLALNRNEQCSPLPGVQVLGHVDSVKYLGIPFNQAPVNDVIVEMLNQSFSDGIKL